MVLLAVLASVPSTAHAQVSASRISVAALVAVTTSSEFDDTDAGIGARVGWHPTATIGVEGELTGYPGNLGDQLPFSRSRIEGLFGVTAGPRMGSIRPFGMARGGFLNFREAPAPFACILIFPPPLPCTLAAGKTVPAFDIGGGVEVFTPRQTFVRIDAADRMLKYPGPVLSADRVASTGGFLGHDLRVTFSFGLGF